MSLISKKRQTITTALLVVVILVLIVQNFLLVGKNTQYVRRIEWLTEQLNRLTVMSEGDSVHPFAALTLDGTEVLLDMSQEKKPKAMLVFTTWCGACVKNIEPWQELVHALRSNQCEVFGVSPDSLSKLNEYKNKYALPFPVYSVVHDSSVLTKHKLLSFPQTILIDSLGLVSGVWAGVLSNKSQTEILNKLKGGGRH